MTYLDLRVFLSFYTCLLTSLEPNLTTVAWRAKIIAMVVESIQLFRWLTENHGLL